MGGLGFQGSPSSLELRTRPGVGDYTACAFLLCCPAEHMLLLAWVSVGTGAVSDAHCDSPSSLSLRDLTDGQSVMRRISSGSSLICWLF